MDFLSDFHNVYWGYIREIWLILAIGFLISGFFYKFIPTNFVERHLGEKGIKPILISSFVGTLLPVCCIGSLPIAITLKKKGATIGAVLAFMIATPATSVSALIVCWKLLGTALTVYIFFAVIIMALIMGIITNRMRTTTPVSIDQAEESCEHGKNEPHCCEHNEPSGIDKFKEVLVYAFITLPKEMGIEILIGIGLASFITVFEPIQHLIQNYLTGFIGYAAVLIIGLLTYVCSTASVPLTDAFVKSGLTSGQALCYLLAGPITSYGTILVIKKDFGTRIVTAYLLVISLLSLFFGLTYDTVFN